MPTKKNLTEIADINETTITKLRTREQKQFWKEYGLQNPYIVVKNFIKEKGLKLYGGQALHEHIVKKDKKGLYSKDEFPDYDVFSPDAWEHAKELANKLNDMGYKFVEARASVLNDDHHKTYKVYVDLLPMLDLTQKGCEVEEFNNNNCKKCGVVSYKDEKPKCISVFNEIPALNVDENSNKIYKETFDYKSGTSLYPTKFFVCSPEFLKVSMYGEISQPHDSPARLPKVATRLEKFESLFESKYKTKCDTQSPKIPETVQPILNMISKFTESKYAIDIGISALNYYLPKANILETNYEIMIMNTVTINKLKLKLEKKFPNHQFKLTERNLYWKQKFDNDTLLYVKLEDGTYYLLLTAHELNSCVPFIKTSSKKYAPSDLMIYHLRYKLELPRLFNESENIHYDVECVLRDLIKAQKKHKKTKKFKRFVSECYGYQVDTRMESAMDRWQDRMTLLKQTKTYIDYPKPGFITKVSPAPKKSMRQPYKPEENFKKKYIYKTKKKLVRNIRF